MCSEEGCKEVVPGVLTIIAPLSRLESGFGLKMNDLEWEEYAEGQWIVLRCDIDGCSDFRYSHQYSGAFEILSYSSAVIKIGNNDIFDNRYFEVASSMLMTNIYFGQCNKLL